MANIYDIVVKDMEGKDVSLSEYKGKVLLIVNTATGCGFTPQYSGLEAMYRKYKEQGFEILDFPCNQFFGQAPGSDEEIHSFCQLKYDVSFKQFHKIDVNGKNEAPLYTFLKEQKKGRIKWNFAKFLVDREGNVVARYGSMAKPESFENEIKGLL